MAARSENRRRAVPSHGWPVGLSFSSNRGYDISVRHLVLTRLSAPLLLVVFLATGTLRAFDAALYHGDDGATPAGVARLYGTDAPKAHYDQCVLGAELRGASTLVEGPEAPGSHADVAFPSPIVHVSPPRSTPHRAATARAPPIVPA
jgi:hypothetical protein